MSPILVEWSDPPKLSRPLPRVVEGTWSQFRRLEDAGIAVRERELVLMEDGRGRALYRIVASDALGLRLELEGASGEVVG